jgi:Transglycosylase SLT domain
MYRASDGYSPPENKERRMEPSPHRRHLHTFAPPGYLWYIQFLLIVLMLSPFGAWGLNLSQPIRQEHPPPVYQDTRPRVWHAPVSPPASPPLPSTEEIAALLEETLPQFDLDPGRLPARFRRQVCERIYNYAVLYRKDIQAMLHRADTHLPMIKRLLHQHELPTYFAYIPLVESAFNEQATHPTSGARGLWQLMALTARAYGLKVSTRLDERLHPHSATLAAVRYLRTLQDRFGAASPLHILAAYNFGENNLAKALQRAQTQDIWPLFVYRRLPYQTRDYLVKIVTLWIIVAHPERFQFILDTAATSPAYSEMPAPRATGAVEIVQRAAGSRE